MFPLIMSWLGVTMPNLHFAFDMRIYPRNGRSSLYPDLSCTHSQYTHILDFPVSRYRRYESLELSRVTSRPIIILVEYQSPAQQAP